MTRKRRPRIVCLGAGTGQSAILQGLAPHDVDLTGIVAVTDNGGHSGILRGMFGIPQVGDSRNCLTALADPDRLLTRLLKFRFQEGPLSGTSLGNLILVAMIQEGKSLSGAIRALSEAMGIRHRLLPISDESTHICAELEDGRTIRGEWEIIERKPRDPIRRLFHQPVVVPTVDALDAIQRSDLLVLCPGSLRTGIVSILLTPGVREAVAASKAKIVYISNLVTQPGQTDGYALSDHIAELTRYLGTVPHGVVVHDGTIRPLLLRAYRAAGAERVKIDAVDRRCRVIRADLVAGTATRDGRGFGPRIGLHHLRHDPAKAARILMKLVGK